MGHDQVNIFNRKIMNTEHIFITPNPPKGEKMYCPNCRKVRKPYRAYRTLNKPISRLLKYSSVNELCPVCFIPMRPIEKRRRIDHNGNQVHGQDNGRHRRVRREQSSRAPLFRGSNPQVAIKIIKQTQNDA